MRDVLIGVDAGTSVVKSIAFDLEGAQIAEAARPNRYETRGTAAEQDMARTWTDAAATLRALAGEVPDLAARTAAVAVTGQGDGTWLIDAAGEPVGPAWLWLDARAASIVETIRASDTDAVRYAATGCGLAACQQGPHLAWMKKHTPEVLARAAHAMHCKDWLFYKLTGTVATDPSEGTFTFGDFRTRRYDDGVVETLGLSAQRHLLPEMIEGTSTSVPLSAEAARETGLLEGTPVVLGYVDVACTALGAGLYDTRSRPGVSIVGSTGMHMRLARTAEEVTLNEARTGYTMAMPAPGVYAQMQSNMAATLNIDWLLSVFAGLLRAQGVEVERKALIARLDEWVASAAPASLLFQPYISEAGERGPFVDADARAGFIGLSTRHGFQDMLRAVFEGMALAARDCYAATGSIPSEVRLTGGAARSRVLRRILAAAVGSDVRTSSREEAGAAGAAMMAAVCIGQYPDMATCADRWVTPTLGAIEPPDDALRATYDRVYTVYAASHAALRPVWKSLAEMREHAT